MAAEAHPRAPVGEWPTREVGPVITIGQKIATGEIVIRNLENDTALVLSNDVDDLRTFVEMLVDELSDLDVGMYYSLQEVQV